MNMLLVVLATFVATSSLASPTPRLVGGNTAADGQFPYMASIRINDTHLCGGSIVDEFWILSSAACIDHYYNQGVWTVVVGTNHLETGGVSYSVDSQMYHGEYLPWSTAYDIGLFKLKNPIKFNNLVQAIKFSDESLINEDAIMTLSGWGSSESLQYLTYNSNKQCNAAVTSQLCYVEDKLDYCNTDIGSPLVSNGVQYGIASFRSSCAAGSPDMYTNVGSFFEWIQFNINYM